MSLAGERSIGALGYFPSYTLGAIMACQFYEAAKRAVPGLEDEMASGNFEPLKAWLNREVRGKHPAAGSRYTYNPALRRRSRVALRAWSAASFFVSTMQCQCSDPFVLVLGKAVSYCRRCGCLWVPPRGRIFNFTAMDTETDYSIHVSK